MVSVIGTGDLRYFKFGAWWDVGSPAIPQFGSLAAWWDASDASTVTEASGRVSQIDDKSGNGLHLTQATAAAQPYWGRTQNGRAVLDFQGAQSMSGGDILDILAGDRTVMGVTKTDVVADHTYWGKSAATSSPGRWSLLRVTLLTSLFQDSGNRNVTVSDAITDARVLTQRLDRTGSGTNKLYRDNVESVSGATVGTTSYDTARIFGIGAYQDSTGTVLDRFFLDGFIAEILVWDTALTVPEMTAAYTYLADKWGI